MEESLFLDFMLKKVIQNWMKLDFIMKLVDEEMFMSAYKVFYIVDVKDFVGVIELVDN